MRSANDFFFFQIIAVKAIIDDNIAVMCRRIDFNEICVDFEFKKNVIALVVKTMEFV